MQAVNGSVIPSGYLRNVPSLLQILLVMLAVNAWTVLRFWQDRQRALIGSRRIPEGNLLGLALIGGSPGALLADESRREQVAKRILAARKRRKAEFSIQAIGEPGFDMLLELYVLEALGKPATLEILQPTTDVPTGVALRWLKVLRREGLATSERCKDGDLWARALIELTPLGRGKLDRYLDSVQDLVNYPPA